MIRRALRLLAPVRRGVNRFFGVLDSEGVVFFQMLLYIHLAAGGAYCVLIAHSLPETLREAFGGYGTAWLWTCIGVLACPVGKLMSARREHRRVWVHNTGLWLQLLGDFCAFCAFLGYVLATREEATWGTPFIAVWVIAALAECGFFLCWRDIRRITQAEKLVRR